MNRPPSVFLRRDVPYRNGIRDSGATRSRHGHDLVTASTYGHTSSSTPIGQWSEPVTSGLIHALLTLSLNSLFTKK